MDGAKLSIPVVVVACLYLAVGVIGFAYHFQGLLTSQPDAIWIEVTEFLAIVCGVFLLRRQNWARWLAIAWMGFHVAISAFYPLQRFAIHALFLVAITWVLFASRYGGIFRRTAQPK